MATIVFNPYSKLGDTWLLGGLNSIIEGNTTSLDHINTTICDYSKTTFDLASSGISDEELASYVPLAVNGYINSDIGVFNDQQQYYLNMLIHGIMRSTYTSILNFISEVEKNVTEELSTPLQLPLLLAISIARGSFNYWDTQVNNLVSGSWKDKLSSIDYINRSNVPKWVVASIQAAAWGYSKGTSNYDITNAPQIAGASYPVILAASLGVTAGLVLWNWQKNINELKFNLKYSEQDVKDVLENLKYPINSRDFDKLSQKAVCEGGCLVSCVPQCTACIGCVTGKWVFARPKEY